MTRIDPFDSVTELSQKIKTGVIDVTDVVNLYLERIDQLDDQINAFRVVFEESARQQAHNAQQRLEDGSDTGPLHGIPVAIKDNIAVEGASTTMGLKPFLEIESDRDNVVVERLREAGAIVIGKTTMAELGFGTTDSSWYGPTSTPFDTDRNAGGSSGGSAAAVAAGLVPFALGTDGGGSIRIPSSLCGVYGIKPTFRRVPRWGRPNGFGSTKPFSEIGPITRSPRDAHLVLKVLSGEHSRDPFSMKPIEDGGETKDLEIAYSPDLGLWPVDTRVEETVEAAVSELEKEVRTIDRIEMTQPYETGELLDIWMMWTEIDYATIAMTANERHDIDLSESDGVPAAIRKRITAGKERDIMEYTMSDLDRTKTYDIYQDVFDQYDLLIAPTLATPPFRNAEEEYTTGPSEIDGQEIDPHIGWAMTYPCNFTGHPAASIPAGFTDGNLPIGLQMIGPRFSDETILDVSNRLTDRLSWREQFPPSGFGSL